MNDDIIAGKRSPLHGTHKPQRDRLTDDDLHQTDAHREYPAGKGRRAGC
ncbi:MAG: hypothetical protein ACYDHM_09310 [Acidiferrobacterales bacterium]